MSCQFALLSNFQDISKVKVFLFPHLKEETPDRDSQKVSGDGWDVEWDQWNEEEDEGEGQIVSMETDEEVLEGNRGFIKNSWLQNCLVSLSPTNDLMAIAFQEKIVLLSQKYDPKNQGTEIETELTTVYQGTLSQEEGEIITAVLCLPLASQKRKNVIFDSIQVSHTSLSARSTQGGPDWTCVIVGFSSGNIRMYTETGTLLLSQLLHTEPIQKLKCHTYQPPRYLGLAEQHEELVILYRKALVTIDGFSLFQSLRACRNQVARATASGGDSILQVPPLAYKKWALQGQEKLLDCCSCGVDTPNPFDQMKTQSIVSGHTASIRLTPPAAAMYVTSGVGPYVGFFYAVEGTAQPILSEVAFAVAHKLKSAIMSAASGWLFGNKQKEEDKQKPKIEPATPLSHRFGLPDKRRQGDTICLSPNNNYAATTDSFGRVTLLDVERGVAVRMWKGYRDAQLGWIEVKEDVHISRQEDHQSRMAQFLIIYAPRRGILEVWASANGPRVAAFNVSKWCTLVCPGYGMMGLNNVTCRGVKTRVFQCSLIDPIGVIKTLDIPFHLALSDKNSKRARDLHLLKKLKAALKEHSEESELLESTVTDLLLDMKIASIRQQGTDRVLGTKYLSAACMQRILKACLQQIAVKDDDSLDIDSKLFVKYCNIHHDLLNLYSRIHQVNQTTASSDSDADVIQVLAKTLRLSESEAAHLCVQLEQFDTVDSQTSSTKHVKFAVDHSFQASTFLGCFHCHLHISEQDSNNKAPSVTIPTRVSEERKHNLASYLFRHVLMENVNPEDLCTVLQDCNLAPALLMKLLLSYWLSDDNRKLSMVANLYRIIKSITSVIDKALVLVDPCEMSPWWQNVRDMCNHSCNIRAAYIIAVTCRGVATELASTKDEDADAETEEQDKGDNSESSDMPPLLDLDCWNTSVKQLEDVLCLSCLLQLSPTEGKSQTVEPITVSITKLMEGGRGAVSELVGCYITQHCLHPGDLFRTCNLTDSLTSTEGAAEATETLQLSAGERLQGQLEVLRQRYPHSLENDVFLSNACWENVVQWNKDPENVQHLQYAMEYLRLVQNALLRQGVGSLLWHMFVAKKFSAAAHLMEKVGKVPKDRLCRKEVGISEVQLTDFVGCICDLLDIVMEANCDSNEVPVFNMEHIWQGVRGPASLVELAIDQKATNYGLLRHHYHLAVIMHAVLVFQMRSVKVISLFDSKGKNSFFLDLHQHPLLPSQNIDAAISTNRKQFLSRVLTNAVLTLDSPKSSENTPSSSPSRKITGAATKWPTLTLEIAKDFGLDLDFLKRHHVCELYSGAHDRLAEEVLQTVNDHELMGSQLLMIAGYRTAHYLLESHKHKGVELLTTVSPSLSSWLKSLEKGQLRQPAVPANDIAMLVQHVANDLPEGYPEYELAISLVDLVQSLS